MIRLTTLGSTRLDGEPNADGLAAAQQPKRLALLAYLAIAHPRYAHRRDTILGLLWPELDHDRARSALRQALHAIRRAAGADAIRSTGNETIEVDPAYFACDVWDLESAAAAGDHGGVLELYQGDVLAGLFLDDSPPFEQWLDGERVALRSLVLRSAWAEAERVVRAESETDLTRAVRLAVSLSELDEGAIYRAMELLACGGQRVAALALYADFTARLRDEMDAVPSRSLTDLADELRRRDDTSVARSAPSADSPLALARDPLPMVRHGRRVTARHAIAASIVAMVAVGVAAQLAPSATAPIDPRRVEVMPFVNETGTGGIDPLARAVSLGVKESLLRVDGVQVVANDRARRTIDPAGTVVRGVVRSNADSLELRADVVNRGSGAIARTVIVRGRTGTPDGSMSVLVGAFADRLNAAVATALYPGWGSSLSQPASYTGYRLFLDGMRRIKLEDHDAAAQSFHRAFAEDSTFTAAGLLEAMEYYQMRRFRSADSIAHRLAARRATLPAIDGHLLDWLRSSLDGERIAARSAMEAVVALAPQADLAWLQLAVDNVETARPREALEALSRIDPAAAFGESWVSYWATQLEALHDLGDHERELATVRDALRRHPELRTLVSYEARALAALGRERELDRLISSIEAAPSVGALDPRTVMRQAALELQAHGKRPASTRLLSRVAQWYVARPASEQMELSSQLGFARTLYLADDRRQARVEMQSLLEAHPSCIDCLGALGVLAARDRDRATADSILTTLDGWSRRFLFGRNLHWQARIAATLGDDDRARSLLAAAFASGTEFDVMTHTDPDLLRIRPESVYRAFARVER
jgi:DNA-binding SARP family transcriptional activator/tetratricopeptide (TPR) repeat protein/TolB-like protein